MWALLFATTAQACVEKLGESFWEAEIGLSAITKRGDLYVWGDNTYFAAGDASIPPFDTSAPAPFNTPSFVTFPMKRAGIWNVAMYSGGDTHQCALMKDGSAACWGYDDGTGKVGGGATAGTNYTSPMWLPGVYADVAAGDDTTCVIDAETWKVWCVGDGAANNAVDGVTGIVQRMWTPVSQIPSAVGIVSGGSTNYAWSATGAGWAWGENDNNQLANGATTPGFAALSTLTGIMGIGAGADHACAWSATWTKCWGLNDNGQVGVGTWTTPVTSPMMIDLPGKAMKVDGGDAHTCGINTDGALYCWGDNWAGQLGLRDTVDRNKPTIPTLFGVEDVLADYATTCALVKGGKVYCFGLLSPLTTTFLSDLGGSGYVTEPVLIPAETFDCSSKPASRGAKKGKGKKAKVAAGLIGGVAGVAAIGMAIRYRRKKNYQALATTSASSLPAV